MDFTTHTYRYLLSTLQAQSYTFQTFETFFKTPARNSIVLRHDIDKLPGNALKMAMLENELNIRGSYYFRVVSGVWDEAIMGQIVALGHELGYHYEDLTITGGDHVKAIRHFEEQLGLFRQIYPVTTICMHGSPLSRYDNRNLWKHYNYRDFGIIGEPYFDVNFNEVFYITDTGRKWNNEKSSVRDKVDTKFNIQIKNTRHLIELIDQNKLPDQLMINTHPQRWLDMGSMWVKELVLQNVKNVIKQYFFK